MSGRYIFPPYSGGQYGAPKARQIPDAEWTRGLNAITYRSSIAKRFHSAAR